nr:Chain B, Nuclear receptor coactivator 2 [synthetic construct]
KHKILHRLLQASS